MAYTFDFVDVFKYTDVLAKGVVLTVTLIGVGGTLGIAVGIFGAWARGYSRLKWLDWVVGAVGVWVGRGRLVGGGLGRTDAA